MCKKLLLPFVLLAFPFLLDAQVKMIDKNRDSQKTEKTATDEEEKTELSAEWNVDSIKQKIDSLQSELGKARAMAKQEGKNGDSSIAGSSSSYGSSEDDPDEKEDENERNTDDPYDEAFNKIRVIEIQLEEERVKLAKAETIKEYHEKYKNKVIDEGFEYLKKVHEFVNGTVYDKYGNLKSPNAEKRKDSTYFELMNYILEGKVVKMKVMLKADSPNWNRRFEIDHLDVYLASTHLKNKGRWKIWMSTRTNQSVNYRDGIKIRDYTSVKEDQFYIEGEIKECMDKNGAFKVKDWRLLSR